MVFKSTFSIVFFSTITLFFAIKNSFFLRQIVRFFHFNNLKPCFVFRQRQNGLVEVGGGLAVDGDGVGRGVRLDAAPQRAAQRAVTAHARQPAQVGPVPSGIQALDVAHPTQAGT